MLLLYQINQHMQKCSQCLNSFTMVKLPRKLPSCLHNICELCLREIMDSKQEVIICGFCSTHVNKEQIDLFPINTSLLMNLRQTPLQASLNRKPTIQEENLISNEEARTDMGIKTTNTANGMCPIHNSPLDVICTTDKHLICCHCALFGSHKNHKLKQTEQFHTDIHTNLRKLDQIKKQNKSLMSDSKNRALQYFEQQITIKTQVLATELEQTTNKIIQEILKKKERTLKDLENYMKDARQSIRSMNLGTEYYQNYKKMIKWQEQCEKIVEKLQNQKYSLDQKIKYYFDSPLEKVDQGLELLQELTMKSRALTVAIDGSLSQFKAKILPFEQISKIIDKMITIGTKQTKDSFQQPEHNPFMNLNTSQIRVSHDQTLNSSVLSSCFQKKQAKNYKIDSPLDFSPRASQKVAKKTMYAKEQKMLQFHAKSPTSYVKNTTPIKTGSRLSIKNVQSSKKEALNTQKTCSILINPQVLTPNVGLRSTLSHQRLPSSSQWRSPSSKIQFKSPPVKQPLPNIVSQRQAQKLYSQFAKDTLTDCFDLSDCQLQSNKIVQYVRRARRIHKVKKLKLCNNSLNVQGFCKMIQLLQGVTNINLANNSLDEQILQALIKYKPQLQWLKIITLTGNPMTLTQKHLGKLQEIKKGGVVVVLS